MGKESEFRLMLYAEDSWKNIMINARIDQPEAQEGCPIVRTFDYRLIEILLKDYVILDTHQDHIFPYIIDKYINYEYEIQPWFKAMPENMFRALEKNLGWHLLIKCKTYKRL